MTGATVPTQPDMDLTGCDREPIHIPGAVQPHGLLLIADAATLLVEGGAGALEARFGADWLGRPLGDLIGADPAALLSNARLGQAPIGPLLGEGDDALTVTLHRSGTKLLAELEPAGEVPMTAAETLAWLDQVGTAFERAATIEAVCERAAVAIRALIGFDRVMVYRFHEDDAGCVVAEDRAPHLGSFLRHHFPATDIPRQARALYIRNRTRAIPTSDYAPLPIRPASLAGVDLSDVAIRSVSPIHLQYLRNMGVAASASISIVKDGMLWGLIACHHDTPRLLAPGLRAAAATLAGGLARQIRAKEEAQAYRERLALHAAADALLPRLGSDAPLVEVARDLGGDLRRMFSAGGFALVDGATVVTDGACPPAAILPALAAWARDHARGEAFATRELGALASPGGGHPATAAGLLAVPLFDERAVLLWFRPERIEEIEWAGNPHKAVGNDGAGPLSPRASFDSWTETVRGRARAWALEEVEAAHRLRRTLREARQTHRMRVLTAELQRTLTDREALIAQKDVLIKEVNHRVQNSLQLVSAFLALQARGAEPAVVAHLTEAQARLSAVALVHRRLYRDDQVETLDLSRYLEELVGDLKASIGDEWGSRMQLDLAPVLIATDRAVNVGLILTELVINATKYAYGGAAGPIAITLEQHGGRFRLIVADEGRGKTGTGQGFGSRMMDAIVARLAGQMDFGDNAPGLRAVLTAPLVDE